MYIFKLFDLEHEKDVIKIKHEYTTFNQFKIAELNVNKEITQLNFYSNILELKV